MQEKVFFLDRDGTINEDSGYVCQPERLELIPNSAKAIALIKQMGFKIVVVSNQSAIGRNIASHEQVNATNNRLIELLIQEHPLAKIDLILYSPDPPGINSTTRKPALGLLQELPSRMDYCKQNSWMAGDKLSDVHFGINAGLPPSQCPLLLTGAGVEELFLCREKSLPTPTTFNDLWELARHVEKTN